MYQKIKFFIVLFLVTFVSRSQQGIPVYSDYLSDNYYLIHPSMAGAASCDKIRLTGRKQWFDQTDAPELQTLSYNGRVGDRSGLGVILFNDKNGFHSEKGAKLTYAHHIMFSRDDIDLNQLSFGLSANLLQSQLDETTWGDSGFDPIVNGIIVQDASYFNVDIGASYNFLNYYAHATVQNAIESKRKIYTEYETANLRRYLLSAGMVFGNEDVVLLEPSVLFQLVEHTKEKWVDINFKAYKNLEFGRVWAALSYRRNFDGAQYLNGSSVPVTEKQQYFSPIVGVNYNKFMLAYTYTYLSGPINFDSTGFHQITLGYDLNCKREKYDCKCPSIN